MSEGAAYGSYLADQDWSEDKNYGHIGGYNGYFSGQAIANTEDDEIYRSELWEPVKYQVRVPNGTYLVTLLLAENYYSAAGKRMFGINVEGNYLVKYLDIYSRVELTKPSVWGGNVVVNDRILDIHFGVVRDYPLLNGLIIEKISGRIDEGSVKPPQKFRLQPNYPNHSIPRPRILYELTETARVDVSIYDTCGRKTTTLGRRYSICWYLYHSLVPGAGQRCLFCQLSTKPAEKITYPLRKCY
jgi:hypothetical protein